MKTITILILILGSLAAHSKAPLLPRNLKTDENLAALVCNTDKIAVFVYKHDVFSNEKKPISDLMSNYKKTNIEYTSSGGSLSASILYNIDEKFRMKELTLKQASLLRGYNMIWGDRYIILFNETKSPNLGKLKKNLDDIFSYDAYDITESKFNSNDKKEFIVHCITLK